MPAAPAPVNRPATVADPAVNENERSSPIGYGPGYVASPEPEVADMRSPSLRTHSYR